MLTPSFQCFNLYGEPNRKYKLMITIQTFTFPASSSEHVVCTGEVSLSLDRPVFRSTEVSVQTYLFICNAAHKKSDTREERTS
jgi:hypothetical protein